MENRIWQLFLICIIISLILIDHAYTLNLTLIKAQKLNRNKFRKIIVQIFGTYKRHLGHAGKAANIQTSLSV